MRIYDSENEIRDFCRDHFPNEKAAHMRYGDLYGWDTDHPPYEGEDYHCTDCGRRLTSKRDATWSN